MDSLACRVPIHERHVAVHQNQPIAKWVALIDCLLNFVDCLLSVVGELGDGLAVGNSEDEHEPIDDVAVGLLVVHDEYFALSFALNRAKVHDLCVKNVRDTDNFADLYQILDLSRLHVN